MIPLFKVFMSEEAKHDVAKVLDSGYIGQGEVVEQFEGDLREWFGWDYLATVNSATSGLHLCVHMVDSPIFSASPMTCTASNMPILANGSHIDWVDINTETLNMDLRKADRDTPAVIPLWAGNSNLDGECPRDTIIDAAHALGVDVQALFNKGARFIVFSFQAIKHVTCGDGGVVLFRDKADMERANLLRWYGIERGAPAGDFRCEANIQEYGFKFHMNDINAAIGRANLKHAEYLIDESRRCADDYNNYLQCDLLDYSADCSYWIYTMLVDDKDGMIKRLKDNDIMSSKVHERNDKHTAFRSYQQHLPELDEVNDKILSIPCGWWVHDTQHIIDAVNG